MRNPSFYFDTAYAALKAAPLRASVKTRIAIIGGGFAGINTALGLAERGISEVVVLESNHIGFGASGRNGGFVFSGFSRGNAALLRDLGREKANILYSGTVNAVNLIRQRVANYRINCDLVDQGVYWANWFRDHKNLLAFQSLYKREFNADWHFVPQHEFRQTVHSERYYDALFEPNAMHFHPLNYALGLAQQAQKMGVQFYENSPATALHKTGTGWRVTTPDGVIECEQVVLACGGYLANLRAQVDRSILPIATYVMVTEPLTTRLPSVLQTQAAIYDSRFAFDYYRPLPDTRIVWGGRISIRDRASSAVQKLLYHDMLTVFPQLTGIKIESAWSGLMSYARHQMPQIGELEPGLWVAQAFGGHGVAPTTYAGELIASAIAEKNSEWQLFAPYGLQSAMKPAGFIGAQLSYWWYESKDAWNAWRMR